MMYKQTRLYLTGCLLLLVTTVSAAAQDAGSFQYQQGIEASQDGDYRQALQHFENARRQGKDSATLTYNLAVTHYKLNQLDQAQALFQELRDRYPEWRDLAHYNLGRIAMRQGDDGEAARYFRLVRRDATNDKLVRLAGEGLARLDLPTPPVSARPARRSFTLLSLSGGVDDNVIAFPDQLQTRSSQGEDSFLEFLGYGQYYVEGTQRDGVRLHGFAYSKRYNDLDILDINSFNIGVTRDVRYNGWQLAYGAGAVYTEVDGEELTTAWQGKVRLGRRVGAHQYMAQYKPAYHDAGSDFPQLDGWQHQADLRWRYDVEQGRWTIRYRLDYNARDDLSTDGTFLSYSPLRNSIMAQGEWYVTRDLTLIAGAEFTNTQYDDDNRLTDIDGVFKVEERDSDEIEFWVRAQYQLHPRWRIMAEYRDTDTDDNFELYEYDRTEAKLTVEFSY